MNQKEGTIMIQNGDKRADSDQQVSEASVNICSDSHILIRPSVNILLRFSDSHSHQEISEASVNICSHSHLWHHFAQSGPLRKLHFTKLLSIQHLSPADLQIRYIPFHYITLNYIRYALRKKLRYYLGIFPKWRTPPPHPPFWEPLIQKKKNIVYFAF